jgi:hypothetical protein
VIFAGYVRFCILNCLRSVDRAELADITSLYLSDSEDNVSKLSSYIRLTHHESMPAVDSVGGDKHAKQSLSWIPRVQFSAVTLISLAISLDSIQEATATMLDEVLYEHDIAIFVQVL